MAVKASPTMRRPIVLVPACSWHIGHHMHHIVQFKYVDAVVHGAHCAPLIAPALGAEADLDTWLDTCDGVLLTGSPSNVHPSYFDQAVHNPALPLDPARDATTLPLLRAAIARGIPLLAICRGFQEVNVALGGSLHQAVQEVAGKFDHRENPLAELEEQYGPAHPVTLMPGGLLARVLGSSEIRVNSLHGQGVDVLAPGLAVEARAEDGLIEAFSLPGAPGFLLGLQWHPEWHLQQNSDACKLFAAFGDACRDYHAALERIP
ncbi:gamma-glutamyl-gamma-aminobutyrate hydrolase family protein [Massilia sp. TS11]|uniref:gamma-glutamyl-gamma-aminobutyrate hydrolase family protein n=1 Tax=Massilia sp. TS11 TaxID=2908003 RepID=UPI001EDB3885|nr:gamma-glutamyl-gamma-aminobutyrate hydrolase family protein [Massilia sp. TS11]MCG2586322.1 gamma-glutamyl-gamma-aminobutyrate hydrolase family protein [Massilia sp. TS11]